MKFLLCLALVPLICANSFVSFHNQYISRFVLTQDIDMHKATSFMCASYQCSADPLADSQCISYNSTTNSYNLQGCPSGQYCPWALYSKSDSYCLHLVPNLPGGNPGDTCSTTNDCGNKYPVCNDGICTSGKAGDSCDDQPDCDVGLACYNVPQDAKCQAQKTVGQSCGSFLTMNICQNSLVCNFGTCIKSFSLGVGAIVDSNVAGQACASGFYSLINDNPDKAICTSPPQSPNLPQPAVCTPGSYCVSSDGSWAAPCTCGFNKNGVAYCPVFPGDDIYQQYFQAMVNYIQNPNINLCHSLDVGQSSCRFMSGDILNDVVNAKRQVDFFTRSLNNDACVKEVYNSDYWYPS